MPPTDFTANPPHPPPDHEAPTPAPGLTALFYPGAAEIARDELSEAALRDAVADSEIEAAYAQVDAVRERTAARGRAERHAMSQARDRERDRPKGGIFPDVRPLRTLIDHLFNMMRPRIRALVLEVLEEERHRIVE